MLHALMESKVFQPSSKEKTVHGAQFFGATFEHRAKLLNTEYEIIPPNFVMAQQISNAV